MSAHKFKAYVGDSEPTLDAVKAVDSINNGIVAYVQQKKLLKDTDAITNEGNVSYDKLLGGSGLDIKRIYAYEDGALVEGGYWPEAHWRDR